MANIPNSLVQAQSNPLKGAYNFQQEFSLNNILHKLQEKMNVETFIYLTGLVIRLLFIALLYVAIRKLFLKFINFLIARFLATQKRDSNSQESMAAVNTALPFIKSFVNFMIFFLFFLLILSELKIDITPVIYSVSIITLVISLGSQTLIKDLINGVITLVEGNMKVGDKVIVGGHTGTIESISLRCLYLRHGSGALHSIPFSEVKDLINFSFGYNVACIAFYMHKNDNLEIVKKAMEEAYLEIKENPRFKNYIRSHFTFHGITDFVEKGGALVKGYVTIQPDPDKLFEAEFNRLVFNKLQDFHFSKESTLKKNIGVTRAIEI